MIQAQHDQDDQDDQDDRGDQDEQAGRRDLPRPGQEPARGPSATVRALTSLVVGLLVGVVATFATTREYGVLLGWMAGAALFVGWMFFTIWPMDAAETAAHAVRDDTGRAASDVLVVLAAVASLGAVGVLLQGGGGGSGGGSKGVAAALSVASVALAWAAVHAMFTTRYARVYYSGKDGGVDFNEDDRPQYSDFAYLAFTIGMTFQVSDTDFTTKDIRRVALRHALLSYLFGAVIIATTINLVAGLSK